MQNKLSIVRYFFIEEMLLIQLNKVIFWLVKLNFKQWILSSLFFYS
jgi:hypothetical protein